MEKNSILVNISCYSLHLITVSCLIVQKPFLLLLYKKRMFIAAPRLVVVINRTKPKSVKSCNHFVPVWTIDHHSFNEYSVPTNMKNQHISRARQEAERYEDVLLKNSEWDPVWNEGICTKSSCLSTYQSEWIATQCS